MHTETKQTRGVGRSGSEKTGGARFPLTLSIGPCGLSRVGQLVPQHMSGSTLSCCDPMLHGYRCILGTKREPVYREPMESELAAASPRSIRLNNDLQSQAHVAGTRSFPLIYSVFFFNSLLILGLD